MKDVQKILEKEHGFLHPEEKRLQYIKKLKKETDFNKTVLANNNKIKRQVSLKEVLKNLTPRDWSSTIYLSIMIGVLGCLGTEIAYEGARCGYYKNIKQKGKTKTIIFVTLLCSLVGFSSCIGVAKLTEQSDKTDRIKDIYNRLSLYLFDYLKTIYPELDDSMLYKYNPGLADNITALLIANMNEADTKKLSAIADDLVNVVKSKKIDMDKYKTTIDCAMGIIKNALNNNKQLYDSIVLAYKGWATSTFYLDPYGQTRYVYIAEKEDTR